MYPVDAVRREKKSLLNDIVDITTTNNDGRLTEEGKEKKNQVIS